MLRRSPLHKKKNKRCHFDHRDDCKDAGDREMGAIAEKYYPAIVKISPDGRNDSITIDTVLFRFFVMYEGRS
ncbi:MAG: hypothetical protein ABL933_19145 [Methyloglobulus sp.]|nr:hypothetical protein [Methyloglobulus sp.]